MRTTIIKAALGIAIALNAFLAGAQSVGELRFGNERTDTVRLTELLDAGAAIDTDNCGRAAFFAHQFIGIPYQAHTLESPDGNETLTIRLDSLDCTTFAETVLSLARTAGERRHSWRDYVYNLRSLRYRGGRIDGYPSRLHYIAEWAVDNIHRGNLEDATRLFPRITHMVKSIDFMSTHRDRYPALADSAAYARIRLTESGYRNHRFPYIKTNDLGSRATKEAFRSGDIVALVSKTDGLDVTHMGVIIKDEKGTPHLLHASSTLGKVTLEEEPLVDFVRRNRNWLGVRVFRIPRQ